MKVELNIDPACTEPRVVIHTDRMTPELEALLRQLGPEGSKALFNWQAPGHPNYPDGVQDDTHLCLCGAQRLAELALSLLREAGQGVE